MRHVLEMNIVSDPIRLSACRPLVRIGAMGEAQAGTSIAVAAVLWSGAKG